MRKIAALQNTIKYINQKNLGSQARRNFVINISMTALLKKYPLKMPIKFHQMMWLIMTI